MYIRDEKTISLNSIRKQNKMCRAGGRRCEHNWTQDQRDARNARRRALYAARTGGGAITSRPETPVEPAEAASTPPQAVSFVSALTFVNLDSSNAAARIEAAETRISEIATRRESHKQALAAATDAETKEVMYSDIQDRNREIIEKQDGIIRELRNNGVDELEIEDVKQHFYTQIETIGEENINTNVNYRDIYSVKAAIMSAGVRYPMSWDEMGSSSKDMWEERTMRGIERLQRIRGGRAANNS